MKLYLLRHGHRGHGPEQDTLTERGIEQARRTAEHIKGIKIDKIICGSSQRSRRTAEEILKALDCPIEYTPEINEQGLGALQGKSGEEYKKALKESGLPEDKFRPEDGENRLDAYERARKFAERLRREKTKNILIVSHAGFISDLITILLGLPMEEGANFKTQFCALSRFELDENFNVKDFSINDITHLAKARA